MTGPVSVAEGAAAAFLFAARAWRSAFGALTLVGVLASGAALAFAHRGFGRGALLLLALMAAEAMARGALFRLARDASDPGRGFAGLQWDALEWRLLATALLRWALFALLAVLALTVLVALYIGVAAAEIGGPHAVAEPEHWRPTLDPLGWSVVGAATLGCVTVVGWIWLRLYLSFAATASRGRVQVLSAWTVTRGRAWRLLAMAILVQAPVAAAILALAAAHAQIATEALVAGFGQALVTLPLSVGLMSYLYDRLGPEDAGAR